MEVAVGRRVDHDHFMTKKKRRRQRIDTLLDALVWMRRTARTQGEWDGSTSSDARDSASAGRKTKKPASRHGLP